MIKKDRIYVEDLRVKGTIGIFDWEKKIKQEISLSYEIDHDNFQLQRKIRLKQQLITKQLLKKLFPLLRKINLSLLKPLQRKLLRW